MEINTIRKKAAADALNELESAFEKVKNRYDRKYQLRNVLHHPKPKNSIDQLALFLMQIRTNATALSSVIGGGALDQRIEMPIQWAEAQLKQLEQIIGEARDLAFDLRAFEIDKSTLKDGTNLLFNDGTDRLKDTTDALSGLGKVWEEAFALAGGICLRHEGLDDGLCQIADALIEETNWISGKAFAVPSRSGVSILPNVVHLSFPEWTIWALPLTAQEVWQLRLRGSESGRPIRSTRILDAVLEHAQLTENKSFSELKKSAPALWGDSDFHCHMGDVFGVFSLGPAYACAAIDLALDPSQEISKQRALTIFHCLSLVDEYKPVQGVLEGQWREVATDKDMTLKYQEWNEAVLSYLKTTSAGFVLDRWKEQRGSLMDALRTVEKTHFDVGRTKLRYLINAAWKGRLEYPSETDQIAKKCKELAELILNRANDKTGSMF
jgi:hypothetical protein